LAALGPTDAGIDFGLTMVWGAFMSKKSHCRLASLTLLDIAAGIAVSAAALPALAADMPTKAPAPIAAPVYNWTGFYLGAHAGYRWADADLTSAGRRQGRIGLDQCLHTIEATGSDCDVEGGLAAALRIRICAAVQQQLD